MSQELIFDRNLLLTRRANAASSLAKADFLIKRSFEDMQEKLSEMNRGFTAVLDLGGRKGYGNLFENILTSNICAELLPDSNAMIADEENLPFKENQFDLIVSVLNLHLVNDLPGCLIRLRQSLKPNGVLIASMFGGGNLPQLREILFDTELELLKGVSPRMMLSVEIKQLGGLLQRAGFSSPVIDKDEVEVHYKHPLNLLKDLQNMAETNIMLSRDKKYVGKIFWQKFVENYINKFSVGENEVVASFEILTMTALKNG
jgi:NADH dehydrogenase [ubiquinone] 1 alpha subcomplex assembly factor 5